MFEVQENTGNESYISSEVRFYTIEDVMELSGWSKKIVLKLFNDPLFPASDYGKAKVVEAHALIDYFSSRRSRKDNRHWKEGEKRNELKKRVGAK